MKQMRKNNPRYRNKETLTFLDHPAQLAGFYPVNREGQGPGTEVLLRDGRVVYVPLSTRTFMDHLAGKMFLNLNVLKDWVRKELEISYYLPLPIAPELLLMAVKTRTVTVKGDKVHGYVNLHALADPLMIQEQDTCSTPFLLLKNGSVFPCLNLQPTIRNRYNLAHLSTHLRDRAKLPPNPTPEDNE